VSPDPGSADLGRGIDSWDDLLALRDSEVHVVGSGSVEGAHLLLFLLDNGFTNLVGHDFATKQDFPRAFRRVHVGWPMAEREAMLQRLLDSVELRYRDRYLEEIEHADAIAVTQGWYLYDSNRPLAESAELQSRFLSLAQLYLALAPGRVVGVSGSQGKSTTTRLIGEILSAAGVEVIQVGNDRHSRQGLDRLRGASADAVVVMEISNRHLKSLSRSPNVAVLTNIYPNHLDEHGGWEGYVEVKSRMLRYQRPADIAVLNADLDVTRDMAAVTAATVHWFGEAVSAERPGVRVGDTALRTDDGAFDLPLQDIPLPGRHNAMNVASAATAALAMGIAPRHIGDAVRRFRGLKHRIQFIWDAGGVRFYDDLNSTTPTASAAALRTLARNVVWIFGGDDKGLDPGELVAEAGAIKLALALPGPGTEKIAVALQTAGVAVELTDNFEAAVRRATAIAVGGDSVLLSPACPGFFTRYYVGADEDTGFKKLVREATLGDAAPTSLPARKPQT
jgi:UDP-N-acetylmuramoylalanine--D-glutamate ligase